MKTLAGVCLSFSLCLGVAFCQTPAIADGGVLNAATFDKTPGAPLAPGQLVSIFGSDLAGSLQVNDTVPLSTKLADDVNVTFNGVTAGLDFVSPNQINAQLPWNVLPQGANSGTATVVVTRSGKSSATQTFNVASFSPGIFTVSASGAGYAVAAIFPDNAYPAPVGAINGVTSRPAKIGDVITLYTTGLGPVDTAIENGDVPPPGKLVNTTTKPTVLIGGVPAPVLFSGLTPQYPGVYLVNVQVPAGAPSGNAVPIQIQFNGGTPSPAAVIIAIQ